MGVAALLATIRIGARGAAIVIPPDPGAEPLVMLNPRVISESAQADDQYEGCLSFFDVRGLVPRPLHIEVACTRPGGQPYILSLDNAMARLAAHEIDPSTGPFGPGDTLVDVLSSVSSAGLKVRAATERSVTLRSPAGVSCRD
jgi:peptide deformylase